MNHKERTSEKVEELFHIPAAGDEVTDPEFMQIYALNAAKEFLEEK